LQYNLVAIKNSVWKEVIKMLRKKYTVQKSFRIDEKLSKDLEALAAILERPQNELLNIALEKLMQENLPWFKDNIIVDCVENFFDNGSESEHFEMDCVMVDIYYMPEKEKVEIDFKLADGAGIIDQSNSEFSEDSINEIKQKLREFATYLDNGSPKVQEFLKRRMDYR
jgi:hypothetical protein